MHVKPLKVFCDVVGRRSFSKAAEENEMSQSGVSQMVHQLEQQLGVKLIDRSKRPFLLTPEGELYYEGCRKLVQRYYALEEEVRTLHQDVAGRVNVASIYSVGLSHMKDCVRRFQDRHPKAVVRVDYQHPDRVYELVESGQADLGLVSYPKESRSIEVLPWRVEPMVLVCAPGHPLARNSSLALEELSGIDLVGFSGELKIRREIDRELAAHQTEVNVVMEFDNIESIKRAIEINAGVSLLPEPTVVREVESGTLAAVPISGAPLSRPLGIIRRRGQAVGRTAMRFIELLTESDGGGRSPAADADVAAAIAGGAENGAARDRGLSPAEDGAQNGAGSDGGRRKRKRHVGRRAAPSPAGHARA